MIAVGTTFAMMGRQIAKAYDLRVDREILRTAGISMAQGIAAASGAAYGGTQLVKAFPGMSVWVGLLIRSPHWSQLSHMQSRPRGNSTSTLCLKAVEALTMQNSGSL